MTTKTEDKADLKRTETGVVKDAKGDSLKAHESVKEANKVESKAATVAKKTNKQLEKSFSNIKGEILEGNSFVVTMTKGDLEIAIPVPMETNTDLVTLDNTFTLITAVLNTTNEEELRTKFGSYVK